MGVEDKMTPSNRKLMAVTNLTARADPQGVERYVAGLSIDRSNIHDAQTQAESKPEAKIPNELDMSRGVITVHYNAKVPFSEINDMRELIEGMGYHITSEKANKGSYRINFEPCNEVA